MANILNLNFWTHLDRYMEPPSIDWVVIMFWLILWILVSFHSRTFHTEEIAKTKFEFPTASYIIFLP